MPPRRTISDFINSQLSLEVSNRCPLCGIFERTGNDFTNHHINHDPSVSEYWNLIRLCQSCHNDLTENRNDGVRERRVKLVKRQLFRNYYGPEAYKTLQLAYENNLVTATPINALELVRRGFLRMSQQNILTVGPATNISTFDTYAVTTEGRNLVEKLGLNLNN